MYKFKQFFQLLKLKAYSFLGLVWTKRFQDKTILLNGRRFKITDSASFVAMYLDIFGHQGYKFETQKVEPYIIDCGANIGLSLVYFNQLYPNAKIIAFEPDPKLFEICKTNTAYFEENLKLYPYAVWNEETTLYFESEGADGGRVEKEKIEKNDKLENNKTSNKNLIEVQAVRLQKYLNQRIDLLKIDIEGAEITVLEDCVDSLHWVGNLFVEFHSFQNSAQRLGQLLSILENAGFRYYIRSEGVWSKKPFIHRDLAGGMDIQLGIWAYRA
ncbi:FkbM family methyltransferase [Bernardetia sp. MNP-M8]|uniref:FkbM family methyltransferase n=1 Tax=Bernardetia sp. MNP-M8 TaxID=3127470 RepID=UPI0030D4280D